MVWGGGQNNPAFINNESQFSASILFGAENDAMAYPQLVKETRNGVTKSLMKADAIGLSPANGSSLPLYVGFDGN